MFPRLHTIELREERRDEGENVMNVSQTHSLSPSSTRMSLIKMCLKIVIVKIECDRRDSKYTVRVCVCV